jgi:hypothetical protein
MLATDMNPANNVRQESVTVGVYSGIAEQSGLPRMLTLERPLPDPMRGVATIRFSIPRRTQVNVTIRSATGALVRNLSGPQSLTPDTYSLTWDGRDDRGATVSRGVYYCRMAAGEFRAIKKLVKLD